MKAAVAITIVDLQRALRATVHDLAEAVETGYPARADVGTKPPRKKPREPVQSRGERHDRARR